MLVLTGYNTARVYVNCADEFRHVNRICFARAVEKNAGLSMTW